MSGTGQIENAFIEQIEGGAVIGEGDAVHVEIDRLHIELTREEAIELADALRKVIELMRGGKDGT